jgi:hypothetical protein
MSPLLGSHYFFGPFSGGLGQIQNKAMIRNLSLTLATVTGSTAKAIAGQQKSLNSLFLFSEFSYSSSFR